jgi:hypothetical protein
MANANELLMAGGVKSAKFDTIGTTITGQLTREPEAREQTDFTTGAVLRWDNGDARMQIIVDLATNQRDLADPTDDGERRLYIKGQMLNAVRAAVRAAAADGLAIGGVLTVKYTGDAEPTKRGFNGAKQYSAAYTPPARQQVANVLNQGDAPTTAPATQAAATTAPPAGVDPAAWAALSDDKRAQFLALTNH